ncbi:MAG TPA: sulfurtransferase TusA family protein [Ktedonobacterales bacterium]|nr:sulfurtransferase TusA family protein [Ktedonobacterales bacterium]
MEATYQADTVVDAKGQACPKPVLMLAKAFKNLGTGQILRISATDPGSKADITAWAEKTGNALLDMVEDSGVFTFYLKKS